MVHILNAYIATCAEVVVVEVLIRHNNCNLHCVTGVVVVIIFTNHPINYE